MKNVKLTYSSADLLGGIDGGGTTTKVVVCNLHGQIVYSFQTGTINHYGAGIENVRENFSTIAVRLVENLGCLPGIIFTGNSALSNLVNPELVQKLTEGVFNPSKIFFHSDVYIALLGFTLGQPGAVLISGTGSMACGIDNNGVYHTTGGWGQILGDEGSGYHLAQEGMKAALRAHDGMSESTQLTGRLKRYFNLEKITDIIDKIYHPPVEKSVIAAFATEVERAAEDGDTVAQKILYEETEWLYKLALAISLKCNTQNLGYYGSVLNRNETILSLLNSRLKPHTIILQAPMFSPEIGALIGAFREAGITLTEKVIENLSKYKSEEQHEKNIAIHS